MYHTNGGHAANKLSNELSHIKWFQKWKSLLVNELSRENCQVSTVNEKSKEI